MNNKIKNNQPHEVNQTFGGEALKKIKEKIENEKLGSSKYMSGQLCKFIDKLPNYKKSDKSTHPGKFKLKTPFGTVTAIKKTNDEVFIAGAGTYQKLIQRILSKKENKTENVLEIYKYLSILSDDDIENIPQFNQKKVPEKGDSKSLAGLCAILMIAEPYRFKDGGGLTRGYIRKVFSDMSDKNGGKADKKALNKIFGAGGKEFKGKNEADAPFAHRNLNSYNEKKKNLKNNNKNTKNIKNKKKKKNRRKNNITNRSITSKALGGKIQMKNLLEYDFKNENMDSFNNETIESIKDNKKRLSTADSYISDNEDEEGGKERIKKAYKESKISFLQAVAKIHELKNKSPKKSKIIAKKNIKEEKELKEERTNNHLKLRKQEINNIIREKRNIKKFSEDI